MKKRILALLLTLALLVVGAAFAVSATEVEGGNDTGSATTYTGIEAQACPCGCGIKIGDILTQGTEFTTGGNKGGHYYANGSAQGKGFGSTVNFMTSNTTTVIYLKDTNWGKIDAIKTAASGDTAAVYYDMRTLTVGYQSTGVKVYIIGNNGVLTGAGKDKSASNDQNGGLAYVYAGSELHLMGDLEVKLASNSVSVPQNGGLIYSAGKVTVTNGVSMTGTKVNANGGAICMASKADLTVTDSSVTGGVAVNGGAIYMTAGISSDYSNLTVSGDSTITGAAVSNLGGTIYGGGYSTLNLNAGTVTGGSSTKEATDKTAGIWSDKEAVGGNIYAARGCTVNLACTVQNGKALNGTGGNIAVCGILNVKPNANVTGGEALKGGNVYCFDSDSTVTNARQGRFNMTGGTIQNGKATLAGGNLYVNASGSKMASESATADTYGDVVNMSDGEIKNGVATGTSTTDAMGGNVYIQHTRFDLTNGTISGGVAGTYTVNEETGAVTGTTIAGEGGNVYTDQKAYLLMEGGTISGGKAQLGGNLRNNTNITTSVFTEITGGTIDGGEALRGGNIYANRRLFVEGNAVVQNGRALHAYRDTGDTKTNAFGGNVMAYSNNQTVQGTAQILNGYSDYNGGNIAAGIGGNNTVIFNLAGSAVVKGGEAANDGGNIYAGDTNASSKFNMTGGTVEGGTAVQHGGYRSNNIHVTSMPMVFTGGEINNTVASAKAGDALYMTADTLTIGGSATANYKESFNVYFTDSASLKVNADFTGEVWLYTWNRIGHETTGAEVYGTKLTSLTKADNTTLVATGTTTATGVYSGKLLLAGTTEHNYASDIRPENKFVAKYAAGVGVVAVNTAEEGATATYELYIAEAAVEYKNGEETVLDWYATVEEAVAAASGKADRYVELYKAENEFAVAADQVVYINFNDKNATVNNAGTVYGFDSYCGPTTEADSEVTVTGNAFVAQVTSPAPDSHKYIALVDAGVTTFHELTLEIVSVNLRPSNETASLYYTADIKGDATLMAKVQKAGVAVTLKGDAAPNALDDYMYTTVPAANGDYNGALVAGIINNNGSEDNGARATTEIYARAYIDLNGEIIMSECVDWSLLEVVNEVAGMYGELGDLQSYFDSLYAWCSEIALPGDKVWADKAEAAV